MSPFFSKSPNLRYFIIILENWLRFHVNVIWTESQERWVDIVANDQGSPEGGLWVLLKEDGELENLVQSGCFFFVWYFSKDEPQLGAWHCSFQSFRDKYCRKVKISIRTLENLHQVTRPFWAWLVLSPDGRSASDSCSTYGYDWRPHPESRPILYKWTTVGFEGWGIPAEFMRVGEVWEDA